MVVWMKFILQIICWATASIVLVITFLGGRFEINCPSAFLKILKFPEWTEGNFKIYKYHEGDLSQKIANQIAYQTNKHFVLKLTAGNLKSASGQLQNSWQLQNNSVNGAILITTVWLISFILFGFSETGNLRFSMWVSQNFCFSLFAFF